MIKHAIYRSKKIGAGTRRDPFRPKVSVYVPFELQDGTNFWNWIHPTLPVQFVLVRADETTIALIDADADNRRLSPIVDEISALQEWLDGMCSDIPGSVISEIELDGIPLSWIGPAVSKRQMFRYIIKHHNFAGKLEKLGNYSALDMVRRSLNDQVADVPVAARTAISNWMKANGLSVSWIDANTTVRDVIHYIVNNYDCPAPGFLPELRF